MLKQRRLNEALTYLEKSLEIKKALKDSMGIASSLLSIGDVKRMRGDFTGAAQLLLDAERFYQLKGRVFNTIAAKNVLGALYFDMKQYDAAIEKCSEALSMAETGGFLEAQADNCFCLYEANKAKQEDKKALTYYERYQLLTDSLKKDDVGRLLAQQELRDRFERKQLTDSLHTVQEMKVFNERIAKDRILRYGLFIGLAFVLFFALFAWNRFRITSLQKKVIEEKKSEVEHKNKEITDSINYARRIQTAILKDEQDSGDLIPDHFIIYRPKDIVSGDFYWMLEKKDVVYVAVADCTGHGVPGAMLTMLGTAFLNEINATEEILDTGIILDTLRDKIVRELAVKGKHGRSRDGMDISLLRINLTTLNAQWSGANNPLYLITDGELKEFQPDKQAVGFSEHTTPFVTHAFHLKKDDQLYLFSDGYADQFGGEKGKKFKLSSLRAKLQSVHAMSLSGQKQELEETFDQWKGSHEQIDDVCLIGLRV